jgi:hypothetical protein
MLRKMLLGSFLVSATALVVCPKERLLFNSVGPSQSTLFVARADGSDERQLLQNSAFDYNASFSVD